jgi:hypothetical protein
MPKKKTYNEDDIRALSKDEALEYYLFSKMEIELIYVIIGYLQEYFGGYPLNDETVDFFFVNEKEKAIIFKQICEKELERRGLPNDVEYTLDEKGFSRVRSTTICAILKQFYTRRESDFLVHKRFILSSKDPLFDTSHHYNNKQYSFLIGVFIRNCYEETQKISIANAPHKVDMTLSFLRNFAAFGSNCLSVNYHFTVPLVTEILVDGENRFWAKIDQFKQQLYQL